MGNYRNECELTIDDVHNVTLKLVEKLIQICDAVGVNYYVAYGSLIGAVRHKGFIPWDDDFDVVCYGMITRSFVTIVYTTRMK